MAKRLQNLEERVTVNCICPGLVDTGLTGVLMTVSPPEWVNPFVLLSIDEARLLSMSRKTTLVLQRTV